MHRFLISEKPIGDSITVTDKEQLHHIREVLRLRLNDELTIFDGSGDEYFCTLGELSKEKVLLTVKEKKSAGSKRVRITIACAIPKQTRMDDIVDKLTQLGVDVIIPMETERVIVKLDDKGKSAKLQRWQKIARSATEQSQRNSLPVVQPVTSIAAVVANSSGFDLKLIPTLAGDKQHIRNILSEAQAENIIVLIGPEGDFTPAEIELAKNAGFTPVSLGKSVLRVDTAAIAVASYINFVLG